MGFGESPKGKTPARVSLQGETWGHSVGPEGKKWGERVVHTEGREAYVSIRIIRSRKV